MRFSAKINSNCIWVAILNLLIQLFYFGMPVVRTDGRSVGRTVKRLPNFVGWVDYHIFLPMVLRCACFAREISVTNKYK